MARRTLAKQDLLLAVLALLDAEPRSGGGVLAELQRRLGAHWAVTGGRVFVALGALEGEGLLAVESDGAGRPVYHVTAEGRAALLERRDAPVLAAMGSGPGPAGAATDGVTGALRDVTVLFTDVVSSSALFDRHRAEHAHGLLQRHFALLRAAAGEHGGQVVKSLGDGLMIVFEAPAAAVGCGLAMQRAAAASDDRLELRVGIASGEAVCDDGDFFGRPIIVARRLCDAARAGEVLVAEATQRLLPAVPDRSPDVMRQLRLKGLSEPVSAGVVANAPPGG